MAADVRVLVRLLAAGGLVAAGLAVQPPAQAAVCGDADGVTVVVDFNQLGGGVQTACVPDQGRADDLFVAAGHTLQNVNNQAFVCRIDNKPGPGTESCARTPPADRYWGLWWSNGTSGTWTYSQQGAYSLDVPDGGSVAFSWNNSSSRSAPSATPPDHDGSAGGSGGSGTGSGSGSGSGGDRDGSGQGRPSDSTSPSASASPDDSSGEATRKPRDKRSRGGDDTRSGDRQDRDDRKKGQRRERDERQDEQRTEAPSESATAEPGGDPAATGEPPAPDDGGGLPAWVAPAAIGALFAAAGVAAYVRRRASGSV